MQRRHGWTGAVDALLHPEAARRHREREALKQVLRKLRRQQGRLQQQHASTTQPDRREQLQTALAICRAQRRKGIALLRAGR